MCDSKSCFDFQFTDRKNALKEIKNLFTSKGRQESDIPVKTMKGNSDIFADCILSSFNACIANSKFPSSLKLTNITQFIKKILKI